MCVCVWIRTIVNNTQSYPKRPLWRRAPPSTPMPLSSLSPAPPLLLQRQISHASVPTSGCSAPCWSAKGQRVGGERKQGRRRARARACVCVCVGGGDLCVQHVKERAHVDACSLHTHTHTHPPPRFPPLGATRCVQLTSLDASCCLRSACWCFSRAFADDDCACGGGM